MLIAIERYNMPLSTHVTLLAFPYRVIIQPIGYVSQLRNHSDSLASFATIFYVTQQYAQVHVPDYYMELPTTSITPLSLLFLLTR